MTEITLWARRSVLLILMAGIVILVAPLTPAGGQTRSGGQTRFDGSWSVLIITEAGDCDRAYRYGVRIVGGRVIYEGEVGVEVSGRVDRNGRISVSVQRGDQRAIGTGRLFGNRGAGTWQGKSSTAQMRRALGGRATLMDRGGSMLQWLHARIGRVICLVAGVCPILTGRFR
jgi:hypothetical protein